MKVIFGLGNPGAKYKDTRHNVGFMLTNRISEKMNISLSKTKNYFYASSSLLDEKFFLIQPATFMNLSGEAVISFINYYKFAFEDLLVVCDDINLDFGVVRLREKGGDGGHNGLASIKHHLQNNEFTRLRIGIGNNFEKGTQSDFVLSKFEKSELELLNKTLDYSVEICYSFITGGIKQAKDFISRSSKK